MILFTYDAPHRKTYDFIMALVANGYTIDCIYAAPWIKMEHKPELVDMTTRGLYYPHTRDIAHNLCIPYIVKPHDKVDGGGDLGIIAGARILKAHVIETFDNIINIHPGKLPENRGLDNVKYAILEDIQQMVTAHYIDAQIDRGRFLCESPVPVYADDTYKDIFNRMMTIQPKVLIDALDCQQGEPIGRGRYHSTMTVGEEHRMMNRFYAYREKWDEESNLPAV